MKIYRAGTELRCANEKCNALIGTLRIDRTSYDPVHIEDFMYPGNRSVPRPGTRIECPVCAGPPKAPEGEDIATQNQKSIEGRTESQPGQKLLGRG